MAATRRATIVLCSVVAFLAASGGVAVGALLVPRPVPQVVASDDEPSEVVVTTRELDDARTVPATVQLSTQRRLLSPVAGTVRAANCSPGTPVASGSTPFTIGGAPLLALALEQPMWRSLERGLRGEDVRQLQEELSRLGYEVEATGVFGQATAARVAELWESVGVTRKRDLPLESVLWLPEESVVPATCPVAVGDQVQAGAELILLGGTPQIASVVLPETLAPGARVAVVGEVAAEISDDQTVRDPAFLEALSTDRTFQQWKEGSGELTIATRLAEPVPVGVVPASALYSVAANTACVLTGDGPAEMRIVGSELGNSFILADPMPGTVTVPVPDGTPSCR